MMKRLFEQKTINCFKHWTRCKHAIMASLKSEVKIGVLAVGMSIISLQAEEVKAQSTSTFNEADTLATEEMDEVVIVGTRQSPTRSLLPQAAVFSKKSDAAAPLPTMEDVLRATPAVDLRERGAKGIQADISVKGGSSDQTMVMLNGVNFTDARTGHQSHSLPIDMDAIGSIELINGIAGAGAYAGAINIKTEPLYPNYLRLSTEGGHNGYFYTNLSGAAKKDRLSAFAATSVRRSDGYTYNTDFCNWNAYTNVNYDSPTAGLFKFQAGFQNRNFGSNGFYAAYNRDQFEETTTALGSLTWVKSINKLRLTANSSYRKNIDRYEWKRGTPNNFHETDNVGAEFWADYSWTGGTTSLGADYTYNHLWSSKLGEKAEKPNGKYTHKTDRNVGNFWLRHIKQWKQFRAGGSAGITATPYGTSALWSISSAWQNKKGWHAEADITQSMRLPTFTDLYYYGAAQINNLDLEPERAITYRIGGGWAENSWNINANIFYRDGKNVIDWVWRDEITIDGVTHLNKWHAEQESRLGTFGTEFVAAFAPSSKFFKKAQVSYAYLNTEKLKDVKTSSTFDYMKHKLSATLQVEPIKNLTVCAIGSLFDRFGEYNHYVKDANGEVMKDEDGKMIIEMKDFEPYFTLDARVQYNLKYVAFHIDASNLTNTKYCDFGGLERPGLWLTAGITATLK